ncbi:hypothetical protein Scep_015969 [Stephania cephalantha]|uniref:Uncharacterized protein n=1 Tax=Stephania cephalantha TaxID=152367 RepID=A0AAP0ILQ1_9MAGN
MEQKAPSTITVRETVEEMVDYKGEGKEVEHWWMAIRRLHNRSRDCERDLFSLASSRNLITYLIGAQPLARRDRSQSEAAAPPRCRGRARVEASVDGVQDGPTHRDRKVELVHRGTLGTKTDATWPDLMPRDMNDEASWRYRR